MNKKILTMGAALVLTLSLAACSGNADSETTVPSTGTVPTTTAPAATTQPQETTVPETTAPEQSETVLVDNEDITVKLKGFNPNDLLGFSMELFLDNKQDESLMFSARNVSVNGFMIDPFWASEVAAGKKANESVTFLSSELEKNGIETVEEITFTLVVYESDDMTAEYLLEQTFTVNP